MELELKHLAGYLPYGLRIQHKTDLARHGKEHKLREWQAVLTPLFLPIEGENYKWLPILRPLSDLIKEIEVDGEKFVPLYKLDSKCEDFYFSYGKETELSIKRKNTNMYHNIMLSQEVLQFLFQWHFDIYGLIENNLAIDINTL